MLLTRPNRKLKSYYTLYTIFSSPFITFHEILYLSEIGNNTNPFWNSYSLVQIDFEVLNEIDDVDNICFFSVPFSILVMALTLKNIKTTNGYFNLQLCMVCITEMACT